MREIQVKVEIIDDDLDFGAYMTYELMVWQRVDRVLLHMITRER